MYHAYGVYEHKRPAWQKGKRSPWSSRGARSTILVLLAVLVGTTIFLCSLGSANEYRRNAQHKMNFQGTARAISQSGHQAQEPPTLGERKHASKPGSGSLHESLHPLQEGIPHVEMDLDTAVSLSEEEEMSSLEVDLDHQEKEKPLGAEKVENVAAKVEELELDLEPLEKTVAIDKGPKPRPAPDSPESDEGIVESGDSTKKHLVEDESNESKQHLSLEQKADSLPEFVWVPFEEAVKDQVLDGWEDEWISDGKYDNRKWGALKEPNIDFVYLWVNGSEDDFQQTMKPWEERSILNDPEGTWINSHGVNRYRDWDELRYSFRSIEKNAGHFMNTIKVLVNSIYDSETPIRKQTPSWLAVDDPAVSKLVQVVSQEELFEADKKACLPAFNSLTIENQMFNTESDVDQFFAMSDDMLLTREHSPSDMYSPLFGAALSFKTNGYSTTSAPTETDAKRFGEKPYLIYTSWLLNRRFGTRKRKGQSHFGHSLSRSIMREAIKAFPQPELRSACKRFRGEPGFQLYSWFVANHYLIERHREVLLWSYIMLRSDVDRDGILSWDERQTIIKELGAGARNAGKSSFRRKLFYHVPSILEKAGLRAPQVNTNSLWTSLDGPQAIRDADCSEFEIDDCLAPGFLTDSSEASTINPTFSSAVIFDRLARQNTRCGDCLLKGLLQQRESGLGPLLPHKETQAADRELVVKAAMRYKYTVVDPSDTRFVMVTDADQVDSTLYRHYVKDQKPLPGQLCLNDDVVTTDEQELADIQSAIRELLNGLFPSQGRAELRGTGTN